MKARSTVRWNQREARTSRKCNFEVRASTMKSCREWKRFQSEPYRSSRSSCLLMRKPPANKARSIAGPWGETHASIAQRDAKPHCSRNCRRDISVQASRDLLDGHIRLCQASKLVFFGCRPGAITARPGLISGGYFRSRSQCCPLALTTRISMPAGAAANSPQPPGVNRTP